VYAPLALWDVLLPVIGGRLKITPSYPQAPWGAPRYRSFNPIGWCVELKPH
jgi:hypothetical protein